MRKLGLCYVVIASVIATSQTWAAGDQSEVSLFDKSRACRQLSEMNAAMSSTAPRKVLASLSYRVAMALNCLR